MNNTQDVTSNKNLYNITRWGEGYFSINAQGNIEVTKASHQQGVELQAIVNAAQQTGLQFPLLIRFPDILQDRVRRVYEAFALAIEETQYQGNYQLVYPIKVNQQQCVVQSLLTTPNYPVGLEAGSKPELMAVMGILNKKATVVCNGYKDRGYIRMALIAQQMGHTVFIVIEKLSELDIILQEANELGIKPCIGVRIRLTSTGSGKWENTAGPKSKFGLNAGQVLELVQTLKNKNALDCLQLMHCHLGSQIANIQDIRKCIHEAARYYIELRRLQVPLSTIDVGGGLGVDYEGTRSNSDCSMNHSVEEYALHIVLGIRNLCEQSGVPVPNLISESGRALTAHHAVLITNIIDAESTIMPLEIPQVRPDDSHVIRDIWDTYQYIEDCPPSELYHFALEALEEANSLFKHGVIDLEDKTKVETLFTIICLAIQKKATEPLEHDLAEIINQRLAAKLFCNVSFFQSMPDAWAIGQIFPVAPISHLHQQPTMHSILQDLTCDSDGTIKQYPGKISVNSTLLLPPFDAQSPYAIGFFLVGAYQEILGNLHNLFGDTNSFDVKLKSEGQFKIEGLVQGDSVTQVLHYANFDTIQLVQSYKKQLLCAQLPPEVLTRYVDELRSHLTSLTYFDGEAVGLRKPVSAPLPRFSHDYDMTPRALGFSMPAEWALHTRCWMAWPCHAETWETIGLERARKAFVQVAQAIAQYEPVVMLVSPKDKSGAQALCPSSIQLIELPLDDSWTRDTGATFLLNSKRQLAGVDWLHNAWGGNYASHRNDDHIAIAMIALEQAHRFHAPIVMEGGAFHVDGEGTVLTTRECLLNPNRNPHLLEHEIESFLSHYLGADKIIWLDHGLLEDETHGHVDEVACFIAPGRVLALVTEDKTDPNYFRLQENVAVLRAVKDAKGRSLEVFTVEQPPATYLNGQRLTLSYINFYLANQGIVMPAFGYPEYDNKAYALMQQLYPSYSITQLDAIDIFTGGGGIHCITQQQP